MFYENRNILRILRQLGRYLVTLLDIILSIKPMKFGICTFCSIPLRFLPEHKSEMVNQLLFGDLFRVYDSKDEWAFINLIHDGYQGWIPAKQITFLSEEEFKTLDSSNKYSSLELFHQISNLSNNEIYSILLGSTIYTNSNRSFFIGKDEFKFDGLLSSTHENTDRNKIIEYSKLYLHAPYLWGGRSPFGIDCSGLTQMAYKMAGINILRDASQQSGHGETINLLSEAKAGDLVFFDNEEEIITHVGILLSGSLIIHASGKVKIDHLDHQGIFSIEEKKYTHKLRLIKSLL